jgi:hypothetical protein
VHILTNKLESLQAVVEDITRTNEAITRLWSDVFGWAPLEAANLLSRSRLDWQVSLSRTLALWIPPQLDQERPDAEGCLILAWANLGALVEGTLKWFMCVYYADYCKNDNAVRDSKGSMVDPDSVNFERLRHFFRKAVWTEYDSYDPWILEIQQRRNAIHAFKDLDIGTFDDYYESLRRYREFLMDVSSRVPEPDWSAYY